MEITPRTSPAPRISAARGGQKNCQLGTGAFVVFVCFYLGGKGSYLREGNDCADTEFSFYLDCSFPPLEIKNLQPQSSSAVLRDAVGLI